MARADSLRALLETIHLFADNGSVWPAGSTQTRSELRTLAREALALLPSPAETPRAALVAQPTGVEVWTNALSIYRAEVGNTRHREAAHAAAAYIDSVLAALAQPGAETQANDPARGGNWSLGWPEPQAVSRRVFAAIDEERGARDEAGNAILAALGCDPEDTKTWPAYDDFTFDPYDSSWEMKGIEDLAYTVTPEQHAALRAIGFGYFWLCYVDGSERHFWNGDAQCPCPVGGSYKAPRPTPADAPAAQEPLSAIQRFEARKAARVAEGPRDPIVIQSADAFEALLPVPAPETLRAALVALVGFWNARADGYRGSSFAAAVYRECARDLEAALAQPGAETQAQPTCEWLTMDSAPHDRMIVVYAPGREGLPDMFSWCRWHPDAGFCIDELREPTRWHAGPTWGMVSPGEPAAPAPTERSAEK